MHQVSNYWMLIYPFNFNAHYERFFFTFLTTRHLAARQDFLTARGITRKK